MCVDLRVPPEFDSGSLEEEETAALGVVRTLEAALALVALEAFGAGA